MSGDRSAGGSQLTHPRSANSFALICCSALGPERGTSSAGLSIVKISAVVL